MRILVRTARAGDAAGIAKVHVETWRTAYRSLVDADHLAQLSIERSESRWAPRIGLPGQVLLVAEENGRIVGFCHGGPNRGGEQPFRGELYALYVLEDRQRRGLGRRLVLALAEALRAESLGSMIVWVLKDNPACRFYEGLGGRPVGSKPVTIGLRTLEEVGYGWTGLESLLDLRVRIVDYDPEWPARYEEERVRLSGALGDAVAEIQHVGSTAVPGLAAKPVIDILLGVRRYPLEASRIAALLSLGYEDQGESGIAGRQFFRKGAPRTHHLHATSWGGPFWESHLRFRDHLRGHPEALRDYDRLKRRLAHDCGDDRAAYTDAKAGFIRGILGSP
jgi:GrpB-like predicted nucleotidyltransferase (UPF0157 family)/GNAT superfamily N-acetyltransferase